MKYESNVAIDIIKKNSDATAKDLFELSEIVKKLEREASQIVLEDEKDRAWLDLPFKEYFKEPLGLFKSEALLIVGIGGSYLGTKAAYDFLDRQMQDLAEDAEEEALYEMERTKSTEIPKGIKRKRLFFLGPCLSFESITKTLSQADEYDLSVLFVSKSGETAEILALIKVVEEYMSERYTDYASRVYGVTENKSGALYRHFKEKSYTLIEMQNVTGRYSILSNVGIIPFQFLGLNVEALMLGAQDAHKDDLIAKYAAHRYFLNNYLKKDLEVFIVYEESLLSFLEWTKQLFAESEGKERRGLFPVSLLFTRDLHSFGQYLQDGKPIFFETTLFFEQDASVNNFNLKAMQATTKSHSAPQIKFILDEKDEYALGYLFFFFQQACAVYCKLAKLDPYSNPGVDVYKKALAKNV